jgi:hypothetical protein
MHGLQAGLTWRCPKQMARHSRLQVELPLLQLPAGLPFTTSWVDQHGPTTADVCALSACWRAAL